MNTEVTKKTLRGYSYPPESPTKNIAVALALLGSLRTIHRVLSVESEIVHGINYVPVSILLSRLEDFIAELPRMEYAESILQGALQVWAYSCVPGRKSIYPDEIPLALTSSVQ